MKKDIGTYEVVKVEERISETEDGEKHSWKYTLQSSIDEDLKLVITSPSEIPDFAVKTKNLKFSVSSSQSKLDVE